MVKPDIVVKLPGFGKNKEENKIEIHKNFNTHEELNTKVNKNKNSKKTVKKTVKITTKSSRLKKGKKGKKGGTLSSKISSLFNYTKKAKDVAVTAVNDSYTYIFDKVAVVSNNITKMVDGVKIYKNNEHIKDVVLQNNYIPNLFSMAKQRFSRKISDVSDNFKSTKTKLIDQMRNATFIIKEDSSFYKYLDMATSHVKDHKRIYAVLAFIIICVFVLFVPFTGVMFFALVPFAFTYLASGASVVFYSATGAITSSIIAPASAGFSSTFVPALSTTSQIATSQIANIATGSANIVSTGTTGVANTLAGVTVTA